MTVTEMEFRDYDDDAWYTVQVSVEGDGGDSSPPDSARLRVKFCGLDGQADDVVFHASDLTKFSLEYISDFDSRFRTLSQQLQDSDCSRVVKGMKVCASHNFKNGDLYFYDAVVEGVDYYKHSFENGQEECLCTFVLCWLHGPLAGHLTVEKIENICTIESGEKRGPAVATFLKIVREKIEIACNSNSLPGAEVTTGNTNHHTEIAILSTEYKRKFPHHSKQETRVTRQPLNETQSSKWMIDYPSERTAQDRDFGGMGNHYLIFVENLEKELTPVQIVEFVRKEVSVSCQAFVFPSLSSELCARGNILVDSQKYFEKLCNFLDNPDQIIVSSRGRPWLITQKTSTNDTLKASIGALVLKSEKIFQTTNIGTTYELKLKIVHSGTNEYRMAKQLRDLYKEFSDHQQRLHKRLFFEEEKILKL